ncbi:MAG TPA: MCE family protein [Streptosporangiaceae bacterium]|nr:MCE family protein [Streptosporangiaceae bacterium]
MIRPNTGGRLAAVFARITRTRRDRLILGTGLAVILALVAAGVVLTQGGSQGKQISAYFSQAIGIYPGSTVRILGVRVGTVNAVHPEGTQVRVTMTVNPGIPVPASVKAVAVASSVVADRYVQLTPAYTAGPQIRDGAVLPMSRTAVPVEVDQVYSSLAKLNAALGPNGVNKHGVLSNAIKIGAANLTGNGAYLHQMITQFTGLSRTLSDSRGNLVATLSNLQQFTSMLKQNNGQVRLAEQQLAQVSAFLAGDRQDLSAAMSELATALSQVKGFIGNNRSLIKANVSKLAGVTSVLVKERASLAEALGTAPLAVDNLVSAYDAANHTLDGRGNLNELSMGKGAATLGSSTTSAAQVSTGVQAPAGSVPVTGTRVGFLPPLPLPAVGTEYGTPQALVKRGHR